MSCGLPRGPKFLGIPMPRKLERLFGRNLREFYGR